MKKLVLILILFSFSLPSFAQEEIKSTYYLIRHAEKDRTDKKNRNPELSDDGKIRADKWASILKDFNIDLVYSTDYLRTKHTATPTAKAHNVEITLYHPMKIDMTKFFKDTAGKNVLIVGHSNTTAEFANKIIGNDAYKSIDDSNNANLYIVTIEGDKKEHILLKMK